MRILNFQQIEILFPVRTLFQKGRGAITNFNPLHAFIVQLPRLAHVSKILVSRYRSSTKRFFLDGLLESLFFARLDFGSNEISHRSIVLLGSAHDAVLLQRIQED